MNNYTINQLFSSEDLINSGFELVHDIWHKIAFETTQIEEDKFIRAFYKGYAKRPSKRISNKSSTIADSVIDILLSTRIPQFSEADVNLIRFGHRLSMGAENIIGLLLEEYIHQCVLPYNWACCWGNCISSVDLCSKDGSLIQIKNKSNTENSSSNKIRKGTNIQKWYRLKASTGETCWNDLNTIIGKPALLCEKNFQEFVIMTVKSNPSLLYLDNDELEIIFPTR